ncbi:hypothetical protein [Hymenobacter jeollabukensis]|uniref:Uncharacterized protein n=1 Tax=Hymenobacter jeollabukensis TaxID=2025313 RepID=A0A5R8WTA6_9BACT|nr:hypothetical protein [Hymenobacter jeollabukensis]TLM94089.1 hypothetical protein FDY95_08675 [Hymenobacter jeollabukensis]
MATTDTPAAAAAPKPKRYRGQLPLTETLLASLALTVARHWQQAELPALLWLSKADLLAQAEAYEQHRTAADNSGDERPPQARRLLALDKEFDAALKHVKNYLKEAYDWETARGYLPAFGISTARYTLPRRRVERVQALAKLLESLAAHGLADRKYGSTYWQPRYAEYAALVQLSLDSAGQRSGKVRTKVLGERQLRQALRALIHHIKANYPTTHNAQLRVFGFQKESYDG